MVSGLCFTILGNLDFFFLKKKKKKKRILKSEKKTRLLGLIFFIFSKFKVF